MQIEFYWLFLLLTFNIAFSNSFLSWSFWYKLLTIFSIMKYLLPFQNSSDSWLLIYLNDPCYYSFSAPMNISINFVNLVFRIQNLTLFNHIQLGNEIVKSAACADSPVAVDPWFNSCGVENMAIVLRSWTCVSWPDGLWGRVLSSQHSFLDAGEDGGMRGFPARCMPLGNIQHEGWANFILCKGHVGLMSKGKGCYCVGKLFGHTVIPPLVFLHLRRVSSNL